MRSLVLATVLLSAPVAALALAGCESGSSLTDLAKLNPSELMSGYSSKIGDLGGVLQGVNSPESAAKALPKAKDLVSNLGGYAEKLNALPPGQLDALMNQYGSKLEPGMKVLDDQIARLAQNPTYGSALSSALKNMPTLK